MSSDITLSSDSIRTLIAYIEGFDKKYTLIYVQEDGADKPFFKAVKSLLDDALGTNNSLSAFPDGNYLALVKDNSTVVGAALFSGISLTGLVSKHPFSGAGTILYTLSLVLNHSFQFEAARNSCFFYQQLKASPISLHLNKQRWWEDKINNERLMYLTNRIYRYQQKHHANQCIIQFISKIYAKRRLTTLENSTITPDAPPQDDLDDSALFFPMDDI